MSDLRVVPENRALAQRPHLLGLPLGYAALLVMATLFLTLSLNYVGRRTLRAGRRLGIREAGDLLRPVRFRDRRAQFARAQGLVRLRKPWIMRLRREERLAEWLPWLIALDGERET